MRRTRTHTRSQRRIGRLGLAIAAVLMVGCQSPPENPYDASFRLHELVERWRTIQQNDWSCQEDGPSDVPLVDCQRIRVELERLALEFPRHGPTLLANAVVSFDTHDYTRSQAYLDTLLTLEPIHPDAAVLRARIAVQEGNLRFARRLLDEQLDLSPDHAGLREARAAVLYLSGELAEAERELELALRLGAPEGRIEYHRGLVAEAAERLADARRHYARALAIDPDDARSRGRLRALELAPMPLEALPAPR